MGKRYPTEFRQRADAPELHRLSSSKRIPTYEEFVSEMDRTLRQAITLMVLNKADNEPIGFVQAYNLNLEAGWCFTMMYADRQYRQSSQRVEAHVAFLDFLFRSLPLRKVYHEVHEFNLDSTRILQSGGFEEEGRFRQHVW